MPAFYARCDDEAVKKEFHGELQRDRPGAAEQDARRDHHHRELRPQLKEGNMVIKAAQSTLSPFKSQPYSMYKISQEGLTGNDRFEGYAIDLIKEIADILS